MKYQVTDICDNTYVIKNVKDISIDEGFVILSDDEDIIVGLFFNPSSVVQID
jgi:hypothetical protein